jgi:hypothetical protein
MFIISFPGRLPQSDDVTNFYVNEGTNKEIIKNKNKNIL